MSSLLPNPDLQLVVARVARQHAQPELQRLHPLALAVARLRELGAGANLYGVARCAAQDVDDVVETVWSETSAK